MRPGDSPTSSLTICTGMAHFRLVNSIREVDATGIMGEAGLNQAPLFTGIECLAQLGALHVRYLLDFGQHAFLLKIRHCSLPAMESLDGNFLLTGRRLHASDRAFLYHLEGRDTDSTVICADMLFAAMDYDRHFSRERLQTHYRELFSGLCNRPGAPVKGLVKS